jgi:hypothetical protein
MHRRREQSRRERTTTFSGDDALASRFGGTFVVRLRLIPG